jgi:hypothetical protein
MSDGVADIWGPRRGPFAVAPRRARSAADSDAHAARRSVGNGLTCHPKWVTGNSAGRRSIGGGYIAAVPSDGGGDLS